MSKITGLGMTLTVEDSNSMARDISEDVNTFTIGNPQALIDVTGLDKFAFERLNGLKDSELQLAGAFNPGTNKSHDVFSDQSNPREFVLTFPGSVATYTLTAVIENYTVQRAADGALTWNVTARQSDGTLGVWS